MLIRFTSPQSHRILSFVLLAALAAPVLVAAAGKPGKGSRDKNAIPADAPKSTVENYTVTVVGVREPTGHVSMKFDMARAAMTAGSSVYGGKLNPNDPDSLKQFADNFAPGVADAKGAAAGAAGAESITPDLSVDLIASPAARRKEKNQKEQKRFICEVSSNGSAVDAQGNVAESPKIGIYATYRMTDDPWGEGRGTIHLKLGKPQATMLKELNGELLVTPGVLLHFSFPGETLKKPVARSDSGREVRIKSVTIGQDGIRVKASVSAPPLAINSFNPGDAFKTMAQSAALLDLVIAGSDGKTRLPRQMSGGGASAQGFASHFGQGTGTGSGGGFGVSTSTSKVKKSVSGREAKNAEKEDEDGSDYEFVFDPLPEQVTIRSIEAALPVYDGETRRIPFTLHNVPIPFPKPGAEDR